MVNEEEVTQALQQPTKVSGRNDVPTEDVSGYLGWEDVQQRVPTAFELGDRPLVVMNLLLQRPDGIEVDLPVHLLSVILRQEE